MAKPKGSKKARKTHVKHVGIIAGMIGTGLELMFTPGKGAVGGSASAATWLMDGSQSIPNRMKYAYSAMYGNAKELSTWTPLIGGAAISAAPRLPLIRIAAAPVNTQVKTFTRGRWGL